MRLAPMLYHDNAETKRKGPVAKAGRSPVAAPKQTTGQYGRRPAGAQLAQPDR